MSEKLKPCPFCGSEAKNYSVNDEVHRIYCGNPNCYIYPDVWHYGTFEDAMQKWNTRAIDNSEAYMLLHKTLLTVWALIPNVEKDAALDELLVCANEIEKFLSQVDDYEGEL